ncbi:MAG TPA: hypothetical protein VN456_11450 [Desulfosporosinus sp.]|nr:hypothetical protein [Desulfosporosinus sp.]
MALTAYFYRSRIYIIDFSVAKDHLAVAPERAGINHFFGEIVQAGYDNSKELVPTRWDSPVNFSLLEKMIEFNILDNYANRKLKLKALITARNGEETLEPYEYYQDQ